MLDVPGEATYFLSRAKVDDLKKVRFIEMQKPPLSIRYRLICLIDQELYFRENQNDR
jgi:hypothetical protein